MYHNNVIEFSSLLHYAATYLPKDKYEHSLRVMLYVMCNDHIPEYVHDDCIVVAIAHDLIEDGKISVSDLPKMSDNTFDALEIITKSEDQSYVDYIKDIKASSLSIPGQIAYWVKIADMKDHLMQKATLTEKLKEKYLEALPYLLP